MPVAPNHSNNLPQEFDWCPECGKKGVYHIRPTGVRQHDGSVLPVGEADRCKYCGWYRSFVRATAPKGNEK